MKRRFSEEQIIGILKEHEAGVSAKELCRKHGMSDASFYKWKAKFFRMIIVQMLITSPLLQATDLILPFAASRSTSA